MKIVAFKTPKPRRFEYKPLFYDADKERLEAKRKLARQLADKKNPSFDTEAMRDELKTRWGSSRRRTKGTYDRVPGIVLVAVAIGLIFLMIYLFSSSGIF